MRLRAGCPGPCDVSRGQSTGVPGAEHGTCRRGEVDQLPGSTHEGVADRDQGDD